MTRAPGLVSCLRCWELHERAGVRVSEQAPHDVDDCRLCRPSAEPTDAGAPIVGSLLPYNPVDWPLSASRPALADPWQVAEVARQFAEMHADSGRPLRLGYDFGQVEVAVVEVYAALTAAYGPVVRPSVQEVYTRVGCRERRAQYALRALQRAGLLHQHADGCLVRDEHGDMHRLAAEYELRIPLAYLDRAQVMEELDETVDRDRLELYLEASAEARDMLTPPTEKAQATAPVEDQCTPSVGLLSTGESGSSFLTEDPPKRNFPQKLLSEEQDGPPCVSRPRMQRGYALARKLVERAPRWQAVPLPLLAAALQPLADLGWSAFHVDRATETYGPVTSSSGLRRVLQAVAAYVTAGQQRRQLQVKQLAVRIVDAHLVAEKGPAVWSDTSSAARQAYEIAVAARAGQRRNDRHAGWTRLLELTEPATQLTAEPTPVPAAADVAAMSTRLRSEQILAAARRRAASDRRGQS